jgi:hypothetical protein
MTLILSMIIDYRLSQALGFRIQTADTAVGAA